jgi:hypothetical protein
MRAGRSFCPAVADCKGGEGAARIVSVGDRGG